MVINVFGKRGSGKTTLIRGNLSDCRAPVVIVDVLGNFQNVNYTQTDSLAVCIEEISAYYDWTKKKEGPEPKKIISLRTSNPTRAADYISACIWEINGGTLILDEIDSVRIKEGSCFDEYIRYGRNHYGDLITGCRRPAEVDRNITAAANKFYCFTTQEMRDIDYFSGTIFGERAYLLSRVEKFHGLFVDYDNGVTGEFAIDPAGKVYHLNEEPLSS